MKNGHYYIERYGAIIRLNHWLTAACFILLSLSGFAMFYPGFFWLSGLFGGGQLMRMLHPWIGVVLFFSYMLLAIRFSKSNLPNRDDIEWSKKIGDVLNNRDENLPELGKYNPGQKFVFWSQALFVPVMFFSGLVIWDWYFYGWTSIPTKRIALLVHSFVAVVAILVIIMHIYAGIWVKGTMRAMTRGSVTAGWAYRHHRKWFRQSLRGAQPTAEPPPSGAD